MSVWLASLHQTKIVAKYVGCIWTQNFLHLSSRVVCKLTLQKGRFKIEMHEKNFSSFNSLPKCMLSITLVFSETNNEPYRAGYSSTFWHFVRVECNGQQVIVGWLTPLAECTSARHIAPGIYLHRLDPEHSQTDGIVRGQVLLTSHIPRRCCRSVKRNRFKWTFNMN